MSEKMKNVTLLHSKDDECPKLFKTQKCIEYNPEKIGESGLGKPYSQLFVVQNNSLKLIKALF